VHAGTMGHRSQYLRLSVLNIIVFFSSRPMDQPVPAEHMNYAVLITGAVVVFSLTYYAVRAKKVYIGSVIEVSFWGLGR